MGDAAGTRPTELRPQDSRSTPAAATSQPAVPREQPEEEPSQPMSGAAYLAHIRAKRAAEAALEQRSRRQRKPQAWLQECGDELPSLAFGAAPDYPPPRGMQRSRASQQRGGNKAVRQQAGRQKAASRPGVSPSKPATVKAASANKTAPAKAPATKAAPAGGAEPVATAAAPAAGEVPASVANAGAAAPAAAEPSRQAPAATAAAAAVPVAVVRPAPAQAATAAAPASAAAGQTVAQPSKPIVLVAARAVARKSYHAAASPAPPAAPAPPVVPASVAEAPVPGRGSATPPRRQRPGDASDTEYQPSEDEPLSEEIEMEVDQLPGGRRAAAQKLQAGGPKVARMSSRRQPLGRAGSGGSASYDWYASAQRTPQGQKRRLGLMKQLASPDQQGGGSGAASGASSGASASVKRSAWEPSHDVCDAPPAKLARCDSGSHAAALLGSPMLAGEEPPLLQPHGGLMGGDDDGVPADPDAWLMDAQQPLGPAAPGARQTDGLHDEHASGLAAAAAAAGGVAAAGGAAAGGGMTHGLGGSIVGLDSLLGADQQMDDDFLLAADMFGGLTAGAAGAGARAGLFESPVKPLAGGGSKGSAARPPLAPLALDAAGSGHDSDSDGPCLTGLPMGGLFAADKWAADGRAATGSLAPAADAVAVNRQSALRHAGSNDSSQLVELVAISGDAGKASAGGKESLAAAAAGGGDVQDVTNMEAPQLRDLLHAAMHELKALRGQLEGSRAEAEGWRQRAEQGEAAMTAFRLQMAGAVAGSQAAAAGESGPLVSSQPMTGLQLPLLQPPLMLLQPHMARRQQAQQEEGRAVGAQQASSQAAGNDAAEQQPEGAAAARNCRPEALGAAGCGVGCVDASDASARCPAAAEAAASPLDGGACCMAAQQAGADAAAPAAGADATCDDVVPASGGLAQQAGAVESSGAAQCRGGMMPALAGGALALMRTLGPAFGGGVPVVVEAAATAEPAQA